MKKLLLLLPFALIVGCAQQEIVTETNFVQVDTGALVENIETGVVATGTIETVEIEHVESDLIFIEGLPTKNIVTAKFKQEFIDMYQYEDSRGYMFALYLGDGHYYNVFRKENGGVGNSKKHGLSGSVPAFKFKEGVSWEIPLSGDIKVSREKDRYGYIFMSVEDIKRDEIRLSSTKETSDIADIVIEIE